MENITFQQLIGTVAVILLLLGAYKTVMEAIKIHREERARNNAPVDKLAKRVDEHDEMLARDKRRIDDMHERIERMGEQNTIMLRGVRALLSHEINGNSTERLEASATEIDDYLMRR